MTNTDPSDEIQYRGELEDGEFVSVRVGTHNIFVSNKDGEPDIYIADHAEVRVEGDHRDNPAIVIGEEEFPTQFAMVSEQEFWDRCHGDDDE